MNGRVAKALRKKATLPFDFEDGTKFRFVKQLYKRFKKEYYAKK
jgi:hypothetical protein